MAGLSSGVESVFEGRLVRKDLVLALKGAFNVPIYVLEFLLGRYCGSNDLEAIKEGLEHVRDYLSTHYARPDEAEQIKAQAKQRGNFRVIDKLTVRLSASEDRFLGELSNLNIKDISVADQFLDDHPMLIGDGVWAEVDLGYDGSIIHKGVVRPFYIAGFKPIQLTTFQRDDFIQARQQMTREEWMRLLIRSVGLEPDHFDHRLQMLLLCRLIGFVENNYNLVELGPRGTGKSFVFEQISPYATLISGGRASVAQIFVNNASGRIGLVGNWDVVAFDEVGGMKLAETDAIQIFKGYLESGMFNRGRQQYTAQGSITFLGNINFDVRTAARSRHLFEPFPDAMQDLAFLDRIHAYLPGWEVPKMRVEFFTKEFGLMVDYFAAYLRDSRKTSYADIADRYFRFGLALNARDTKAAKKTTSGLIKLLHPAGDPTVEEVREYATLGLELRRRVKEQLKKMGGVEYHATALSLIPSDGSPEFIVSLPESGSGELIPKGSLEPGTVFVAGIEDGSDKVALWRLETSVSGGSGKASLLAQGGGLMKQCFEVAYAFVKRHQRELFSNRELNDLDIRLQPNAIVGGGNASNITTGMAVAIVSAVTGMPVREQLVVLGGLTLQGAPIGLTGFADILQVVAEAGAQRVLVPVENRREVSVMPAEILDKIDLIFYADPKTAINKAFKE